MERSVEIGKLKLVENEKIGNKKLKSIFDELSHSKEELPISECSDFLNKLADAFDFPKEITTYKYKDEKRAMQTFYEYPKETKMKMVDYVLKERLKIKANLNYYQFQNAFVIFLLGQPKNPHHYPYYLKNHPIFKLGKKLEFRQFTLGESNIFKDKILTKKKEGSVKIIQINQNKFFIFFSISKNKIN